MSSRLIALAGALTLLAEAFPAKATEPNGFPCSGFRILDFRFVHPYIVKAALFVRGRHRDSDEQKDHARTPAGSRPRTPGRVGAFVSIREIRVALLTPARLPALA